METPPATRGTRIRLAIKASGLTLTQVAERLGLTRQGLSDILANRSPGDRHITAIATLLGVEADWVVDGGPLPESLRQTRGEHAAPTAAAGFFQTTVDAALIRLRDMRTTAPESFLHVVDRLPQQARRWVRLARLPFRALKELSQDDLLAIVVASGTTLNAEQVPIFTEGLLDTLRTLSIVSKTTVPRTRNDAADRPGRALPPDVFDVLRGALLVLRTERKAFHRPASDVERALRVLWSRQMTYTWPAATKQKLNDMRVEDGVEIAAAEPEALHVVDEMKST
jgi:transcriptional regulator with XRE-family HTH domain